MKKRALSILLIIITLAASVSACGKKKIDEDKRIKVGITMYDEFDPFTNTIASKIQEKLYELGNEAGLDVICDVTYSNKSQMVQNDQVQDFIHKDYDAICVNLVDRTDAMQIIDMAKNANVPVVFFNRELVKEDLERWDKLYYVGARPQQSGELQGALVVNALSDAKRFEQIDFNSDGKIQYVMLEGEAGHQDALIRTKVSVEEIEKAGYELDKLGDEIANWSREQAETKMTSILAGYPWQVELVIANDDNIALGALDALENYGVPMLPLIVGVNGNKEVMELIKEGKIEGTVYNDGITKGETIGTMAFYLGQNKRIPSDIEILNNKYVYVSYEMINRDNVDSFLEKATY